MPAADRRPTTGAGRLPAAGVGWRSPAVEVPPGAVLADEPARLVLAAGLALVPVPGPELDRALAREQPAVAGCQHVEAGPAHGRVELQRRRAGRRVPGGKQVGGVPDGEGAEPR